MEFNMDDFVDAPRPEDITPQDLKDLFEGLDNLLSGKCPELSCSVHYRNNLARKERFGSTRITYVGGHAVYSYGIPDVSAVAADKDLMARVEAAALRILAGTNEEGESAEILDDVPTQVVTEIYLVGDGALGDDPMEIFREVVSGDVDTVHDAHVNLLADGDHEVQ